MLAILFSVWTVRIHCYVSFSINGSSQEDLINRFNSLIDGCKNKMRIDLWRSDNQQIPLVTYYTDDIWKHTYSLALSEKDISKMIVTPISFFSTFALLKNK